VIEGNLPGEVVSGSGTGGPFAKFVQSDEFIGLLQNYSYLWKNSAAAASVSGVPVGSIISFAGAAAPAGWLLCNGQSLVRLAYPALFAVIGAEYGSGVSGAATFSAPDLSGKVVIGVSGSYAVRSIGGSKDSVVVSHGHGGQTGGVPAGATIGTSVDGTHQHTVSIAVSHGNAGGIQRISYEGKDSGSVINAGMDGQGAHSHTVADHVHTINTEGVSGADKNMQPYMTLNYVIRYQ